MSVTCLAGVGGCFAGTYCLGKCVSRILANRLDSLVEKFAPAALGGSKVNVTGVRLQVGRKLSIRVENLRVLNLEPYKSPFLLDLNDILVELDLHTALKSKFNDIIIPLILARGCDLIHEKDGLTSSNVRALLDAMKAAEVAEDEKSAKDQQESERRHALLDEAREASANANAHAKEKADSHAKALSAKSKRMWQHLVDKVRGKEEEPEKGMKVILVKLDVEHIKIQMTTSSHARSGVPSAKTPVPAVKFEHFSEETGTNKASGLVRCVIERIIVGSLAQMVDVSSLLGRDDSKLDAEGTSDSSSYCVLT